jgi:hypothetical protein
MNKKTYILIIIALITLNNCSKPYLPPVIAANSNYLVVEGVINTGQDSTIIKLSRTVQLSSAVGTKPELNATVVVESDANASYPLIAIGNGSYASPGLNLSSSNKYHLKITTADNEAYQSDFVPVKNSPPIDSVYYLVKSNGLQINADTHDASKSTTYYRWDFSETWIIHSAFSSIFEYTSIPKDTVVSRPLGDLVYTCWLSDVSNNIILASSAKLSRDIITNNEIAFIASTSEKIATRYSILVKQYALTTDAFNYWQQLKKNTEQLGSIFDAQPSEISGNIHSITNPSEPVIGYISAGSYSQSRIFIDTRNLPAWQAISPNSACFIDTLLFSKPPNGENQVANEIYLGYQIPLYPILLRPGSPIILGYAASSPQCVDCTLRGTNKKPAFWINN